MTQFSKWLTLPAAFALAMWAIGLPNAHARPRYLGVFKEVYPERSETATCAICHKGKDKTKRTEYGVAVGEALGKKNVKDEEVIKKAIKEAEGKLPKE